MTTIIATSHDRIKSMLKERADEIREELRGSMLFGQPIDMDDVDSLVCCAYGLGAARVTLRREEERKVLERMEDR